MRAYLLRRLALGAVTALVLSLVVFALLRSVPGDAARMLLGSDVSQSPEQLRELRHILGIDKPFPIAYAGWLGGAVHGDLGQSLFTGRSVSAEIKSRLPVTIELTAWALFFSAAIGLPLGILAAITEGSAADHLARIAGALGLSMPNFWFGTLILVYGAILFSWSPSLGYRSITGQPLQNVVQFVIPGFVIGIGLASSLSRIVRTSFLETLHEDYVRTARAKGITEGAVIVRHALRNAIIPILTLLSLQLGLVIVGTVIIENVFSLPGLGQLLLERILAKDFPVSQGLIFLYGLLIIALNLLTDLAYAFADPRIRYS